MISESPTSENNRPNLARNATARFLAEGMLLLIAQLSSIIIARYLGPSGKGLASLLALIAAMAIMFADFGLTSSGVYLVGRREYSPQNATSTFLTVGIAAGVTIAALLSVFRFELAEMLFGGKYHGLILILALGIPASLLYNWFSGILRGQEQIVSLSYVNVVAGMVGICVFVLTLYILDMGPVSIIWGVNATAILGLIGTIYLLSRQGIRFFPGFDLGLLKNSIHYGLRGQIGQILQFMNYRFDLLVVNYFLGIASVGTYGLGAGAAQIILQIPNALSYALYSRVSVGARTESNLLTCTIARQSMLLSVLAALLLAPIGYIGIPLVFGTSFRSSIMAMWLLLPGMIALSYYKVIGVHLAGQGHPEYYSYGAGVSVAITILLDFTLIPRFGINGAAITSSIAYIAGAAICIHWFVRSTKIVGIAQLFVPERDDLNICRRFFTALYVGRLRPRKKDKRQT